jgi:hypothetical protein
MVHQRLCNEIEEAIEKLESLQSNWNGKDEVGNWFGELVHWERAIADQEELVRDLLKEYASSMAGLTDLEEKADLETPPWK